MDFVLRTALTSYRTLPIPKDPALLIPGGKFLAVDAGKLAILATATSTSIAYTEDGAPVGQNYVLIVAVNDEMQFVGTADQNFVATDLYNEVDIVLSGSNQQIDLGASTTDVLKVLPDTFDTTVNLVGSPLKVLVAINKFLLHVL